MSNNVVNKIVKIFSWGIMAASIIFTVVFFYRLSGAEKVAQIDVAGPFIMWGYILVAIAILLSLLFPLVNIIFNPKNGLKALVGILGLGLAFLIGYLLADPTIMIGTTENPNFANKTILILADTGIIATYILFAVAILSLLYVTIKGLITK